MVHIFFSFVLSFCREQPNYYLTIYLPAIQLQGVDRWCHWSAHFCLALFFTLFIVSLRSHLFGFFLFRFCWLCSIRVLFILRLFWTVNEFFSFLLNKKKKWKIFILSPLSIFVLMPFAREDILVCLLMSSIVRVNIFVLQTN